MRLFPIFLIVFWVIILIAPEIIAYLIWGFFIFIWLNILLFIRPIKWEKESYVKFWNYKIFR